MIIKTTVEPPKETNFGAKNRIVQECKITVFDSAGRETVLVRIFGRFEK